MEAISLETVVSKIRERSEQIVRQSLVSIDDDEVATYRIEITTDNSKRNSLPPRFSLSGNEEYLAEFDLVQAEEDEKELDAVHNNKSMPEKKDKEAKDVMTKKDSVAVESAPAATEKKDENESIELVARFSPFRNQKQGKEPIQPRFSPFRKKKQTKDDVKSGSVHDGVVLAVAAVAPVAGFSPFRKKKQARESAEPAKRPSVSYFKASTEPEAQSTPPPPGNNKRSGVKSSASLESVVSASSFDSKRSARSGMIYLKASPDAVTTSTPGKKLLQATSFEPATESTPVRKKEAAKESIQPDANSTPDRKNEDAKESIQPDAMSTPVRKKEDVKESIQLDAKSTPTKRQKNASESFVVGGENIDVKSTPVKEDEDLVSVDLDNVNTPVKKSKKDDDTKSTTASSGSDRSPTMSPIATHKRRGANQNATEELSLFERYLENVLDKIAGSCNFIPPVPQKCIPRTCDPAVEEEEEMKLSVENILADKFQRSKQKARERKVETKAEKKEEEKEAEKKTKKKKSRRTFAPVCTSEAHVKQPPTVEWGIKPSEDESDFSSVAKGFAVGEFLQKRVSRLISLETNDEDAGEKEMDARVEDEEPTSAGDAVVSVTPVRMNKKKKVVEEIPGKRGNERHEDGPNDASYDYSFFDDVDSRSGSDSDSEYTTEMVQVDFDPSKLADTTDADKYLAREVLRRYAEMTGVSLDELIEEFVDESLASITLDTFPMER
jgi:hypothetical protein